VIGAGAELAPGVDIPPATKEPGDLLGLAAHLLGRLTTPSQAAIRAEMQIRLQEALNQMDPLDREVLTLRHFEELTNGETAQVLGLQKAAASNRYVRALKRLKDVLSGMPGFFE
jgi:RNA polymerase sigma-70 factor (ECF subfamily)